MVRRKFRLIFALPMSIALVVSAAVFVHKMQASVPQGNNLVCFSGLMDTQRQRIRVSQRGMILVDRVITSPTHVDPKLLRSWTLYATQGDLWLQFGSGPSVLSQKLSPVNQVLLHQTWSSGTSTQNVMFLGPRHGAGVPVTIEVTPYQT